MMIVKLELRKQEALVTSQDGTLRVHVSAPVARRRLGILSKAYFHAELTKGVPPIGADFPVGAKEWLEIGDEVKGQAW